MTPEDLKYMQSWRPGHGCILSTKPDPNGNGEPLDYDAIRYYAGLTWDDELYVVCESISPSNIARILSAIRDPRSSTCIGGTPSDDEVDGATLGGVVFDTADTDEGGGSDDG